MAKEGSETNRGKHSVCLPKGKGLSRQNVRQKKIGPKKKRSLSTKRGKIPIPKGRE